MEVNFSINLDLGKKEHSKKQQCVSSRCNCGEESTLEKWLDTIQKLAKSINVK